jgi:hypothetical protein
MVLKVVAHSIRVAHRIAPSKWGLRLNPDSIMLKVGFVEVLQVSRVIDSAEGMGDCWFHELLCRRKSGVIGASWLVGLPTPTLGFVIPTIWIYSTRRWSTAGVQGLEAWLGLAWLGFACFTRNAKGREPLGCGRNR